MKKFLKENFATIVLVVILLIFLKGCGDSQRLIRMEKEIKIENELSAKRYDELKNEYKSSKDELKLFVNEQITTSTNAIMGKKGSDVIIQIPKDEKK